MRPQEISNAVKHQQLQSRVTRLEKLLGKIARSMLKTEDYSKQEPIEPAIAELAKGVQHAKPVRPVRIKDEPEVPA